MMLGKATAGCVSGHWQPLVVVAHWRLGQMFQLMHEMQLLLEHCPQLTDWLLMLHKGRRKCSRGGCTQAFLGCSADQAVQGCASSAEVEHVQQRQVWQYIGVADLCQCKKLLPRHRHAGAGTCRAPHLHSEPCQCTPTSAIKDCADSGSPIQAVQQVSS